MKEVWKVIPGYDGVYQVSDQGRVKRVGVAPGARLGVKKLSLNTNGYRVTGLFQNGKKRMRYVHRLVARTFIGPCPKGKGVNHKNGIKTDNRPSNLEYLTQKENVRHAIDVLGRSLRGEANGQSKLTANDVREIRRLYATGRHSLSEIGNMFSISSGHISHIVNRNKWSHIK